MLVNFNRGYGYIVMINIVAEIPSQDKLTKTKMCLAKF